MRSVVSNLPLKHALFSTNLLAEITKANSSIITQTPSGGKATQRLGSPGCCLGVEITIGYELLHLHQIHIKLLTGNVYSKATLTLRAVLEECS